jgi:hypothetical protein
MGASSRFARGQLKSRRRAPVSDRLLTATNSWWDDGPEGAFPAGRALGFASNVIVDVDVDMDRDHGPPAPVGNRATDIAEVMLRKITKTS